MNDIYKKALRDFYEKQISEYSESEKEFKRKRDEVSMKIRNINEGKARSDAQEGTTIVFRDVSDITSKPL